MMDGSRFDDIAPLYDREVKETIQELLVDSGFINAVKHVIGDVDWDDFSYEMSQYNTKYDFQSRTISPVIWGMAGKTSSSISASNWEALDSQDQHLIISNHRDIVLDAGILNILRVERNLPTTEIAIGDNLLVYPWIKKLVRLNKSFIVQRSAAVREMLIASKKLSEYIHYAINEKKESVWLAQREGRAKDSDDRTQLSLLKMLTLSSNMPFLDSIKDLKIVPLAISYEYDPCDYLKAKEFQLKRDNPEYKKDSKEDLLNMETGLLGFKGNIHFRFGKQINKQLDQITATDKKEQLDAVAKCIDGEIHRNYKHFPCNYIAYDLLEGGNRFADKYTTAEISDFRAYLKKQIARIDIPNPDINFLNTKLLQMYSNTLKNYLIATEFG